MITGPAVRLLLALGEFGRCADWKRADDEITTRTGHPIQVVATQAGPERTHRDHRAEAQPRAQISEPRLGHLPNLVSG